MNCMGTFFCLLIIGIAAMMDGSRGRVEQEISMDLEINSLLEVDHSSH